MSGRDEGSGTSPFSLGLPTTAEPSDDELTGSRATAEALQPRPDDEPEPDDLPPREGGRSEHSGEWLDWIEPTHPGDRADDSNAWDTPDDEPGTGHTILYDEEPRLIDRTGGGGRPVRPLRRPSVQPDRERRGKGPLVLLAGAGLVLAVASIAVAVTARSPASTTTPTPGAAAGPASSGAAPHAQTTAGCVQQRTPERVSGSGVGGSGDGPDAILAFEYAYYVHRSGARARAVVAEDARAVPSAAEIQAGIDAVATGTRYCTDITRLADGRWMLTLTEQEPDRTPSVFSQIVTTVERDGRTLISAVAPA